MDQRHNLVTKFTNFFVEKFRITIIIFIGLLVLGFFSYNNFLKREGFPPIQVPNALIQTSYFVNDANKVNDEITTPIEKALSDVDEIKKIQSQTQNNISIVNVEFDQKTTSKEGVKVIKDEIESEVTFPDKATVNYQTFNAGAIDGKNDMLISLCSCNDLPLEDLQNKAGNVSEELDKLNQVTRAEAIEIVDQKKNPITGETFNYQSGINRVGVRENGKLKFSEAVDIGIIKKDQVGTIELSNAVQDEIGQLKEEGELDNIKVDYSGDFSQTLRNQIGDLESNALTALLAVVAVVFLFIGWRSSLIAGIFIPTVLAATFVGLYAIGYTLNVLTLYSLILVLGLFVDDAIVVVEAIDYYRKRGNRGLKAIIKAVDDIGPADVSGTLTTILVFAPMAFLTGILGDFVKFIPVTVILALAFSILIALSVIPLLANVILTSGKKKKDSLLRKVVYGPTLLVEKLGQCIEKFVNWYLKRPVIAGVILLLSLGLIGIGGYYANQLEFSVFPSPDDSDRMMIQASFPEKNTIKDSEKTIKRIDGVLKEKAGDEIKSVNYIASDKNQAMATVDLVDMSQREITSSEFVEIFKNSFEDFKGASVKVETMSAGPPSQDYQFFAQVFSSKKNKLKKASQDIKKFIKGQDLPSGVKVEEVKIDNIDRLAKIDGRRYAQVKVKLSDTENTQAVVELEERLKGEYDKERLAKLSLEEDALGFDQGFQGQFLESFDSAIFVLGLAIILLYLLLVFQFNSFSLPFLILLAIPFTFPLLFPTLYLTDNPMSFFVLIGIIALSGIVVNNTIILTDFIRRARLGGKSIQKAVSESIKVRFRPILTTTTTTVVAILPLLFTDPFWESMTLTIIAGLISSMILIVLAYPVYYVIIEKVRNTVKSYLKKLLNNN